MLEVRGQGLCVIFLAEGDTCIKYAWHDPCLCRGNDPSVTVHCSMQSEGILIYMKFRTGNQAVWHIIKEKEKLV